MTTDSTRRFSNRVGDYVRYRPSYPPEMIEQLAARGILMPKSIVADIGSGTGLLAELFLRRGNRVFGIEPNAEMRRAGERHLAAFGQFTSINAAAEQTTLPDAAIDLIVAGQAFHWFDRRLAREEFKRILRPSTTASNPPDNVALIWNERLVSGSPFLIAYETLLRDFSTDYAAMDHRLITDSVIAEFFAPHRVTASTFANRQVFDFAGLKGRLLSSSYAPAAGDRRHEPMLDALQKIFDAHHVAGHASFEYATNLYTSRL